MNDLFCDPKPAVGARSAGEDAGGQYRVPIEPVALISFSNGAMMYIDNYIIADASVVRTQIYLTQEQQRCLERLAAATGRTTART